MFAAGYELHQIHDYLWEIPPSGGMRVPGRIYSSRKMIEKYLLAVSKTGKGNVTETR